jgi:mannose-6-phosphate isomerase-like protein (cupin superfamily)
MSVHDPIHGSTYSFSREGDTLYVETWLEPGACLPEHFHPTLDETWEALEGTARVKLDGLWCDLAPGQGPKPVPRKARHELRNESAGTVHLMATATPPGNLEEFLTESAWAAREGLFNARNLPTSLRGARWVAEFAYRFRDETVMTSPPPALQRLVLPLAARLTGTSGRRPPLAVRR